MTSSPPRSSQQHSFTPSTTERTEPQRLGPAPVSTNLASQEPQPHDAPSSSAELDHPHILLPFSLLTASRDRLVPSTARLEQYYADLAEVIAVLEPFDLTLGDDQQEEAFDLGVENAMSPEDIDLVENWIEDLLAPSPYQFHDVKIDAQDGHTPWLSTAYEYDEPLERLYGEPDLELSSCEEDAMEDAIRCSDGEGEYDTVEEAYTNELGEPLVLHLGTSGQGQLPGFALEEDDDEENAASTRARKRLRGL